MEDNSAKIHIRRYFSISMYFVGIDISNHKHDCCFMSASTQTVITKFTFKNDKSGFEQLITVLHFLPLPEDIRIGFYHAYSLKSLTRLRDRLVRQRSFILWKSQMFWITHFQNLNHSLMSVYPKLRYTCLRTTAPPPKKWLGWILLLMTSSVPYQEENSHHNSFSA